MKNFKEYIDYVLKKEYQRLASAENPFLMSGDIGMALFLYYLQSKTDDVKYTDMAKKILDNIVSKISNKSSLEIFNGVTGVALSVILLNNKGFVDDNIDDVLGDIDDYVYRRTVEVLEKYKQKYENTCLDILFYLAIRFNRCHNQEQKEIFSKLWFALFNKLYQNLSPDFFIEPIPSAIKYKMAQFIMVSTLGVKMNPDFKSRISKIFTELSNFVFSYFPQLQFNRLILYSALTSAVKVIDLDTKWKNYLDRLMSSISIKYIIEYEILPNDLFLTHGLCCLFFLLKHLNVTISKDIAEAFFVKIKTSELTKCRYEDGARLKFYGLDGVLSVIMVLVDLKPELLYEKN